MEESGQVKEKVSVKRIVLNVFKFIGFMILALVPLQLIVILMGLQDRFSVGVNSIFGAVYLAITVGIIMLLRCKYLKYASSEGKWSLTARDIGFALLYFFLMRVVATVGTLMINLVYDEDMSANDEALQSLTGAAEMSFMPYYVLFLLTLAVLVPIAEELTYRGIGVNLFFKRHRFWLPLIFTSTIFGLIHSPTNIISFLLYGSLGVLFFLAYNRRRNVVDSILVHILNNGIAAVALIFY